MAIGREDGVQRGLRALFGSGAVGDLSDGELLDWFGRDGGRGEPAGAAFRALVERHGPMVLRVCLRSLGDPDDALDACQATFLILARKAGTVRSRDSVASWLHGVAIRVSADARASAARRRAHERRGGEQAARRAIGRDRPDLDPGPSPEALPALHEEVGRLPEKFRAPVVLCHLEGLTHEEAARRLGMPVGTVRSRLSRARDWLRLGLTRRGLAPAAATGLALAAGRADAAPAALLGRAVEAAIGSAAAGEVPAGVVPLIRKEMARMARRQLKMVAVAAMALGVAAGVGLGFGVPTPPPPSLATADDPTGPTPVAAPQGPAPLPGRAEVRDALKGWWERMQTLQFRERSHPDLGPDGRPVPGSFVILVDYAHAAGNRRALRFGSISRDGIESSFAEQRCDGMTKVKSGRTGKPPNEDIWVLASDQTDTRDRYEGAQSTVTWLLMFAAGSDSRPFYTYIDEGAPLAISRDADGKARVVLTLKRMGTDIPYELDPDHGYLPRHVGGFFDTRVTRFARVGSVWFPAEGTTSGGRERFEVVDLAINRPIPDARFTMPPELKRRAIRLSPTPPGLYGPETLAKARAHPGDAANVAALVAMIEDPSASSEVRVEAIELMLKDHADDPAMPRVRGQVVAWMAGTEGGRPEAFLRGAVDRAGAGEAKARATLDLARFLRRRGDHRLQEYWIDVRPGQADAPGAPPSTHEATAAADADEADRLLRSLDDDGGPVAAEARAERDEMANFGLGKVAPEIVGEDLDGRPLRLSDYRGRVIALVFWGDWCGICRAEYAAGRALAKSFADDQALIKAGAYPRFALLGVNSDPDRARPRALAQSGEVAGRSWWDGGTSGPIARAWKVEGWPTIYVLDASGKIRAKNIRGAQVPRAVEAIMAEGMAGRRAAATAPATTP